MIIKASDRRRASRTNAVFAVKLHSEARPGRLGLARDTSGDGLLVVTPSSFQLGERLQVTVFAGDEELALSGRVTRVDENDLSSPETWRWRLGIALDEPLPSVVVEEGARNHKRLRAA
jgi:hypothetical protein